MPPSSQLWEGVSAPASSQLRITPDAVTQGPVSGSAFSFADNGVPVYSLGGAYTAAVQGL